jgi:hypothetical protein
LKIGTKLAATYTYNVSYVSRFGILIDYVRIPWDRPTLFEAAIGLNFLLQTNYLLKENFASGPFFCAPQMEVPPQGLRSGSNYT